MSAEEYIQGPASDDWDWDPCDWTPDAAAHGLSYTSTLKAATRASTGTSSDKSLLHIDYAAAERKLASTVYELKDARVIRRTEKALQVTAPALNATAWIPKSIIISYTPLTIPRWFAQKLLDNDITATPGDFEGLCPYCGGQHCDCGTDI